MSTQQTDYGTLHVLSRDEIFAATAAAINGALHTVGFTGGSTPKAFYPHAVEHGLISERSRRYLTWSTSDERCVPLGSDESNYGHAARGLLDPLGIPAGNRMPWPVEKEPVQAAADFNRAWSLRFSPDYCFDLCLLGMGDDCHTASIFPASPLVESGTKDNFAAVEVPGKGWRLSVTRAGLGRCARIVITVTGAGKADALAAVIRGEYEPGSKPVQLLRDFAARTTWLCDEAAAARI